MLRRTNFTGFFLQPYLFREGQRKGGKRERNDGAEAAVTMRRRLPGKGQRGKEEGESPE